METGGSHPSQVLALRVQSSWQRVQHGQKGPEEETVLSSQQPDLMKRRFDIFLPLHVGEFIHFRHDCMGKLFETCPSWLAADIPAKDFG